MNVGTKSYPKHSKSGRFIGNPVEDVSNSSLELPATPVELLGDRNEPDKPVLELDSDGIQDSQGGLEVEDDPVPDVLPELPVELLMSGPKLLEAPAVELEKVNALVPVLDKSSGCDDPPVELDKPAVLLDEPEEPGRPVLDEGRDDELDGPDSLAVDPSPVVPDVYPPVPAPVLDEANNDDPVELDSSDPPTLSASPVVPDEPAPLEAAPEPPVDDESSDQDPVELANPGGPEVPELVVGAFASVELLYSPPVPPENPVLENPIDDEPVKLGPADVALPVLDATPTAPVEDSKVERE